jgi:hypothetical protein
LKEYLQQPTTKWPKGEGFNFSESCKVARLHALRKNFERGYPMTHLDDYREELESHYRESLTNSKHMAKLIPILTDVVTNELKTILANKTVSIIFDGGI